MLKVLIRMCIKLLLNTYSIIMHRIINKGRGHQWKVFAWGVQQFDPTDTHACEEGCSPVGRWPLPFFKTLQLTQCHVRYQQPREKIDGNCDINAALIKMHTVHNPLLRRNIGFFKKL